MTMLNLFKAVPGKGIHTKYNHKYMHIHDMCHTDSLVQFGRVSELGFMMLLAIFQQNHDTIRNKPVFEPTIMDFCEQQIAASKDNWATRDPNLWRKNL